MFRCTDALTVIVTYSGNYLGAVEYCKERCHGSKVEPRQGFSDGSNIARSDPDHSGLSSLDCRTVGYSASASAALEAVAPGLNSQLRSSLSVYYKQFTIHLGNVLYIFGIWIFVWLNSFLCLVN